MDQNLNKKITGINTFQHDVPFLTHFNSVALALGTILKAPRAISKRGSALIRMFPGSNFVFRMTQNALDPKTVHCLKDDDVDESLRELGIIHGYRRENNSVMQAIVTLFRYTNETMNFWTHILPAVYLIWLLCTFFQTMPLVSDPYYLPFVCYMITLCVYPLMSSLAHAFSCLSLLATHVCFFMDYATLALYSWGATLLYYNYMIPDAMVHSTYASIYIPVAAVISILTTVMTCLSRTFPQEWSSCKALRLSAFVIPFIWVSIPLFWRYFAYLFSNEAVSTSLTYHGRQFIGVFLAAFFYATHIPERFIPGKFDFFGNSHNLLHIFGISASFQQLKGVLVDMEERREFFESNQWHSSPFWVLLVTPLIVLSDFIVILYFTNQMKNQSLVVKKKN
ncbi:UNVERIFIED_CONTAM: hypothetical protein RMT77_002622 [Armadillidium vulgare]|nr:Membrane progestin receptor gamma [Armadillidium vulgare]